MGAPVIEWQILAKDPDGAAAFYERLFDWRVDTDNPLGYRRIAAGTAAGTAAGIGGGIWPAPPDGHNFVQLFVAVDDVPASAAQAERLGARPIVPPQKLPDGDELAIMLDPFGMPFGIIKKARDTSPAR
jgi:predicted enzyme related to lactoylglutathione lyase